MHDYLTALDLSETIGGRVLSRDMRDLLRGTPLAPKGVVEAGFDGYPNRPQNSRCADCDLSYERAPFEKPQRGTQDLERQSQRVQPSL